LSLEEFEERVGAVYRVATRAELEALSADLEPEMATPDAKPTAVAATDAIPPHGRRFAILSNLEHHSIAVVPRRLDVSAILGNVELDLRDAKFGSGATEIHLRGVLGNIAIVLPAGTQLEQHASALLSSFECPASPRAHGPHGPVVTITGSALLAAVEIRFAEPAAHTDRAALRAGNRLDRPRRRS
jgi:hypothetical protein